MATDILIIGGGGAGLIAACSAQSQGAKVTLVTKSTAGLANCAAYAGEDSQDRFTVSPQRSTGN